MKKYVDIMAKCRSKIESLKEGKGAFAEKITVALSSGLQNVQNHGEYAYLLSTRMHSLFTITYKASCIASTLVTNDDSRKRVVQLFSNVHQDACNRLQEVVSVVESAVSIPAISADLEKLEEARTNFLDAMKAAPEALEKIYKTNKRTVRVHVVKDEEGSIGVEAE